MVREGMSDGSKTSSTSNSSNRKEPGWKYYFCPNLNDSTIVTCNFCGKTSKGGICQQKEHLIGNSRNVEVCKKCPPNVKMEIAGFVQSKKMAKVVAFEPLKDTDDFDFGDDEDVEEVEIEQMNDKGKKVRYENEVSSARKRQKGDTAKSQIARMFMRQGGVVTTSMHQPNIKEACDKELRDQTIQYIARFFYQAGLSFNVARLDSFKKMIEAIGRHGPNLKPPSYHELRVPLLKEEVIYTNELMKGHKEEWAKHGCSIMLDAWTDRRQRTIINFLVNCSLGTMFMKSVDASAYVKSGDKLFELLDKFVEEIGEQNVVQVITDNGSNYVAAGKLLQLKRPNLYWTPCAAHCIDMILEDIWKIEKVKKTISKAISLVGYIYNHTGVLNMMREFTQKRELVRHGMTRFVTTFLTLQSVYKQKHCLRNIFNSEIWRQSKWSKDVKAKRVVDVVHQISFWKNVIYTLKVMGPLVHVLRLANNEKKPAMGYMYEAMDRAKETIENAFNKNEVMYKEIFEIIDKRWECQLHRSLHAAGYYLNPGFFYYDSSIENCKELMEGLMNCVARLVPDIDVQDKIMNELILYQHAQELFGNPMVIRSRKTRSPVQWWSLFGCSAPNLQQLAIKILSLTCSAWGCERNWSIFEYIHTKKRNRLEHKKLQDLVYVKYNQCLKHRFNKRDLIDPITLDDIDYSNEWLVGEIEENEPMFDDDSLTWDVVQQASGAREPLRNTRTSSFTRQSSTSTLRFMEIEEEEPSDDDTNEEEISGHNLEGIDSDVEEFDV